MSATFRTLSLLASAAALCAARSAAAQLAEHRHLAHAVHTSPVVQPLALGTAARWSDPATWGGTPPVAGAHVVIPEGRSVILDVATPALGGIAVRGTLSADEGTVAITAGYVLVDGGRLEIGTADRPFPGQATITLTGTSAAELPQTPGFGAKVLAVRGGTLSLHGRAIVRAWTRLAADASAGATQLTLADAPGWHAGDRIVVATSSRNQQQFDTVEVRAISGATVSLATPLRFRHLGAVRVAGGVSVDVRAEVGLLSHNIVVQGDAASQGLRIGGHAMFMDGAREAVIQIARAEFRRMGQLNVVGRYPIHFHLMGAAATSYVRDAAVHSTIQRGIVLHGVQGVQLTGNVVFNTVGHNVVVEDAQTTGNTLDRNLALLNRQANPLQTAPEFVAQNDRLPANFWLKAARNTVTRNSAAGSFDNGFSYDGIDGTGPIDFRDNVAHAAMGAEGVGAGDFDIMAGVLIVGEEPRPATDVIADNLVYHNTTGFWPEETGTFVIDRMIAADNDLHTVNRGVGNRVRYRDATFIGTLTEPRDRGATAVHYQYGSDVWLERPRFINSAGAAIAGFTDVAEMPQGNLWLQGGRSIGGAPVLAYGDEGIITYEDDALRPAGTYVPALPFATSACTRVADMPPNDDEAVVSWRCPRRYSYTELDVRDRSRLSTRRHRTTPIRRSDGLRFTGGMFGYHAITDAGLRYDIETASATGYALRLHEGMNGQTGALPVRVPVHSPPSAVHRTGTATGGPGTLSPASRLRAATSAADFAANPLTTFWYDATARAVLVTADRRWVSVVTTAPVAALCAPDDRATPAERGIGTLLRYAQARLASDSGATPASAHDIVQAATCR